MELTRRGVLPSRYSNSVLYIFSKLMLRTMEINPSRPTIAVILFKQFHCPVSASYLTITKLSGARGGGAAAAALNNHQYYRYWVCTIKLHSRPECATTGIRNRALLLAGRRWQARYVWRQIHIGPFVRSTFLFLLLMTRGSSSLPLFISPIRKNIRRCPIVPVSTPLRN